MAFASYAAVVSACIRCKSQMYLLQEKKQDADPMMLLPTSELTGLSRC